ncbi:Lrp/AsnC family transcriptional regulator for asnA, asnC and gidA [Kineococcus xinjiangensis]|uniref:Lrp/AsnC family transcriptional regulator for asnA, asnC and gidA n=1 Tax=Kineococcus xinjiangensis TaxID=512762 RepID=A0A2S6IMA0_9ACTN|nr:Lrp/AsnC family transcriptional regulator [Kineococcus xinjiangensis]PPK95311.1 Lrp/AsnC family transcriptional regulator for asnA, asnC and gidA [Kineococcus xinjiangensis]
MPKDLRATTARARRSRVDAVDRELIQHLQDDGRMSYAALAKAVGLSEAAVRQRVQRLLEGGVMQVVAVTDPMTVNLMRQTMIGIRVDGDTRQVAARLAEVPEVDYVVLCAGSFDVLCELTCADDEQLLELLNSQIRSIPGVRSTETFLYLELVKQTYAWGGGPVERIAAEQ